MGCANSKQKSRCRNCQGPYSPVTRSYSMHVHHPPQTRGDTYHIVALTSSTLGSLTSHNDHRTDDFRIGNGQKIGQEIENGIVDKEEFSMGLIEAKTWSNMIDQKIPKIVPRTPIRTPPGEPETINTWELMEGLEDISPLRSPTHLLRSFSFDVVRNPVVPDSPVAVDRPKSRFQDQSGNEDCVNHNVEPLIADFDPEVISAFRKSFEELESEDDRFVFIRKQPPWDGNEVFSDNKKMDKDKDRVVLYFTSLRGVRKTYEDCCHVRVILKGVGVRVDERDVSMHSGFKEELKELLKDKFIGAALPRVFLGDKYIGGADEIRQLHEDGKLEKLLERCDKLDCDGGGGVVCDACGDIRFVPCETCSGSCKIYYEDADEDEDETEEAEEGEFGFQRCPDCNENGLLRCPICCY